MTEVLRTRYMVLRLVFLLVNLFHWKINQKTLMVMALLTMKIYVLQSRVRLLHMVVLIQMLMVLQIKMINVQLKHGIDSIQWMSFTGYR